MIEQQPTRTQDWLRLAALLPLLLLATIGRQALSVDVENLAMKSTGTAIADVSALQKREFGANPTLILLASPRETEPGAAAEAAIRNWVEQLKARDEVVHVDQAKAPAPDHYCLAFELRTRPDGRYAEFVEQFSSYARQSLPASYELAISGLPVIEIALAEGLEHEQRRIIPVLIAALALMLFMVYRAPALVVGALIAPLASLYMIEGLEGWLGLAIDPISGLLGPTVLTVGVATSVHVLERYRRELHGHKSVAQASRTAAGQLRVPFLLAMSTTVAGFLGLLASPVPAVRKFGMLASLGVLLATGLALLVFPSALRLWHRGGALARELRSTRHCAWHARLVQAWAKPICIVAAVALLMAIGGLQKARVDNDLLNLLPNSHPARIETARIADTMGGSQTVELLLPPGEESFGVLSIARLMTETVKLDGIVSPAATPRFSEAGYGLLSFVMAPGGSSARAALFSELRRVARDSGWPGAQVVGLAAHIAHDSNALVQGQRDGLLATTLALWLVMAIGFRSWKMGLLGLVPNLLPLILINGALAQLGRPLSVASSMIGTVMMGLVVDATIHWLHAYRAAHGSALGRVARALREVRRAILITTMVLVVGFASLLLGDLPPTIEFGTLAVTTLVIALLADLILLPALVILAEKKRLRG